MIAGKELTVNNVLYVPKVYMNFVKGYVDDGYPSRL